MSTVVGTFWYFMLSCIGFTLGSRYSYIYNASDEFLSPVHQLQEPVYQLQLDSNVKGKLPSEGLSFVIFVSLVANFALIVLIVTVLGVKRRLAAQVSSAEGEERADVGRKDRLQSDEIEGGRPQESETKAMEEQLKASEGEDVSLEEEEPNKMDSNLQAVSGKDDGASEGVCVESSVESYRRYVGLLASKKACLAIASADGIAAQPESSYSVRLSSPIKEQHAHASGLTNFGSDQLSLSVSGTGEASEGPSILTQCPPAAEASADDALLASTAFSLLPPPFNAVSPHLSNSSQHILSRNCAAEIHVSQVVFSYLHQLLSLKDRQIRVSEKKLNLKEQGSAMKRTKMMSKMKKQVEKENRLYIRTLLSYNIWLFALVFLFGVYFKLSNLFYMVVFQQSQDDWWCKHLGICIRKRFILAVVLLLCSSAICKIKIFDNRIFDIIFVLFVLQLLGLDRHLVAAFIPVVLTHSTFAILMYWKYSKNRLVPTAAGLVVAYFVASFLTAILSIGLVSESDWNRCYHQFVEEAIRVLLT
ncbi:uncharacterized protein LOC126316734 [Schistocerca gregaria]|uniref:uncharacterized protein LOC126316734 n=1 Tax=Schistocerca gregaria TaxID=7010 RepID=UPI00211DBC0B|nr:uncharacterized protein LOC126316734 [Schistocerca gregaria]